MLTRLTKFSKLFSDPVGRKLLAAVVVALGLTLLFTFLKATPQEGRIVVGYTPFDKRLGPWYELYQIPLTGLLIALVNIFIAGAIYDKDRLMSYLVIGSSVIIEVLLIVVIANFIVFFPS